MNAFPLVSAQAAAGAARNLAAILYLLVPVLVYVTCPCPDRPLDWAQSLFARCAAACLQKPSSP